MTVDAGEISILVYRREFFADILANSFLVVTFSARGDWDVRLQSSQGSGLSNVDMTGRALGYVNFLFAAAFVHELQGNSSRRGVGSVGGGGKLVTSSAVGGDWLLRFPVTIETGVVAARNVFKCSQGWLVCVGPSSSWCLCYCAGLRMAE
jgi:hypothetical protein